jgi:uncharacterized protein YkwD
MVLDPLIGASSEEVRAVYGTPQALEANEYGAVWNIYHSNYQQFILIGIREGMVTTVYSNSPSLRIFGIAPGTSREQVRATLRTELGDPLTMIRKANGFYPITNREQKDVFTDGRAYYTFFYDILGGTGLTAVQIVDVTSEQSIRLLPAPSGELSSAMERLSFHLANAARVRAGITMLPWNDTLATISRDHSRDMLEHDYFDHVDTCGLDSSERVQAAGITATLCSENIARNHPNAISAHESLMNTEGHRSNLLSPATHMGVGVCMGSGAILMTQLFVAGCDAP